MTSFATLLQRLTGHPRRRPTGRPPPRKAHRPRPAAIPSLLVLEDRTLPSKFLVTNLHDSGGGSLRQAVLDANAHPGPDNVAFAAALGGTIALTSGQLALTDDLFINGPGADRLTVSGTDHNRVFDVAGGVSAAIDGLTIAHGKADTSGGGGIRNEAGATLTLEKDSLSDDQAVGVAGLDEFGGGLLNLGRANVRDCTFTNNRATGGGAFTAVGGSAGGAIDNFGGAYLTVDDSLFSNNRAVSADGAFYFALGGAIENNAGLNGFDPSQAVPSTALLTDCRFLDNRAQGGAQGFANGGAIMSEGLGTSMTLTRCLINGNSSVGGDGGPNQGIAGGIMNIGNMEIVACAITNNQAVGGKNGTIAADTPYAGGAFGGGIENNFGGVLHITDSLIAGNVAQGGASAAGPGGSAFGGGISNSPGATMTVTNGLIVANRALAGAGGAGTASLPAGLGFGGGIDNSGSSTATLVECLIAGNIAQGSAGSAGARGSDGLGGGLAVGEAALYGSSEDSHLTVNNCVIVGNLALGGAGGQGANGGDGLGGGLAILVGSTATVSTSDIEHNSALGGTKGAGGTAGHGVGGGVYNLGTFAGVFNVIKHNKASTSNDDTFP